MEIGSGKNRAKRFIWHNMCACEWCITIWVDWMRICIFHLYINLIILSGNLSAFYIYVYEFWIPCIVYKRINSLLSISIRYNLVTVSAVAWLPSPQISHNIAPEKERLSTLSLYNAIYWDTLFTCVCVCIISRFSLPFRRLTNINELPNCRINV